MSLSGIINKIKQLYAKGAFHIIFGTFATKFVAFFGSIFIVRILSKEDYGLVGYVENIYSYAFVIAGLGLSNATLRYLIISDDSRKKLYFDYIVKNSIVCNLIISIIIIIINYLIEYPAGFKETKYLLPILALGLPFQDLVNDGLFSLRALFRNKQYAFLSFIVSVSLIFGRVLGATLNGSRGVIISKVIIEAVFGIMILLFISRLFTPSNTGKLSNKDVKEVNSYSIQYMITNGLWMIFTLNDVFILGLFCSEPTVVADYKVAYVLPGNISIIANAIAVFISPYFVKYENKPAWIRQNFKKAYGVNAVILAAVCLALFLLAESLITLLYGQQYTNVVGLMRILIIASYCNAGLRSITANVLAAMGKIKYNMVVSFAGMIAQIVLDIILVQKYQAVGIAVASCIVYFVMAVTLLTMFIKSYYSHF